MKVDLPSKPGENVRPFVPARWTSSRINAVRLANKGARILANVGRFRRITARVVKTKIKTESDKMKIDLHSKPGERGRRYIQVSDFSFEAYPVQVSRVFRSFLQATGSEIKTHSLRHGVIKIICP